MKKKFSFVLLWIKDNLPLLGVVFVGLTVAYLNIVWNKSYSGWDNIIAELDVFRYARQVFFGAWLEHQSFGAPAAQGHLSEVPRLPIIFFLKFVFPDNLLRYFYIFGTYIIGGMGMYFYISKVWLKKVSKMANWLGFLGGVFYLLHILTLQQFYISFEMFMAQYAFLPFLLISIHQFIPKNKESVFSRLTVKNLLLFLLVQFLIAPSAHTQTVFYLAVLFSLVYTIVISWGLGWLRAFLLAFMVGFITLVANIYWIIPNLYYGIHNAHYVAESRDNILFGPESVGSIKDASTFSNLTGGTQYLFNWKDFSFSEDRFHFIFNEWNDHLSRLDVKIVLQVFGLITLLGLFTTILDKEMGRARLAIAYVYIFCLALIWLDLFPTGPILDILYRNDSFLEAFRNPFTKLSIIYSFVSVLLFVHFVSLFVDFLARQKEKYIPSSLIANTLVFFLTGLIVFTAWPSFQGNFISEKLQLEYPQEYFSMFEYLKTQDRDLRILQLPQLGHAGWEYYDWQFLGKDNGYQGMGFYFFGFPQAFVNRDSDRWIETSDFFYHELKYALDKKDHQHFLSILEKYNVDLVIVDETKIDSTLKHDHKFDHQLAVNAGLKKVFEENFISIYRRNDDQAENYLLTPEKVSFVDTQTSRVRKDQTYLNEGDYVLAEGEMAGIVYPFNDVYKHQPNVSLVDNKLSRVDEEILKGDYEIYIPSVIEGSYYHVPVNLRLSDQLVQIEFPRNKVIVGGEEIILPKIPNFNFNLDDSYEEIIVFFNNQGIVVKQGQTVQPVLRLETEGELNLTYSEKRGELRYLSDGKLDQSNLDRNIAGSLDIDWQKLKRGITKKIKDVSRISFISEFDSLQLNIDQNPSINCSSPRRGQIDRNEDEQGFTYSADKYGVNCNGFTFDYPSTAYSYFLNLVGENIKGRGIKLFVNYSQAEIVPEDYLLTDGQFDQVIAFAQLSDDPTSKFHLNWETRSFGKVSQDRLEQMTLNAFPIEIASRIKLQKDMTNPEIENNLKVYYSRTYMDNLTVVDYECQSKKCYLGIDQSHDDLWLMLDTKTRDFRPHYRLNNWANVWSVENGKRRVIIFYLPELVATISMIFIFGGTSILLFYYISHMRRKKVRNERRKKTHNKVKRRLLGGR